MSTRCAIAIKNGKRYEWIYCHYDGYLDGAGKILKNNYDKKKAEELLKLGDISSLESEIDSTEAYGRDRGEKGVSSKIVTSLRDLVNKTDRYGCDYVYILDGNEWLVLDMSEESVKPKRFSNKIKGANIMNRTAVRNELLKIAREIEAFKIDDQRTRGQVSLPSARGFSPTIAAHIRDVLYNGIANSGHQVSKSAMKQEWSEYLTLVDSNRGNNKYHYYAIYSFSDGGSKYYVGANVYGRIGEIGGQTDLTDKFAGGPVDSLQEAMSAVNKHLRAKIQKGYKPTTMKA